MHIPVWEQQAQEISHEDFKVVAQNICSKAPQLKDVKAPRSYKGLEFPYWVSMSCDGTYPPPPQKKTQYIYINALGLAAFNNTLSTLSKSGDGSVPSQKTTFKSEEQTRWCIPIWQSKEDEEAWGHHRSYTKI